MNRYEWEDALVDAQTTGVIPNGALLLALKLARAINWSPKDKRPAGLYWKNEDAVESVGASRATYFRYRKTLVQTGFLTQARGNLLPTLPEKSLVETTESLPETEKSLVETEQSLGDTPLSEDTFSVDELSEETLNEEGPTTSAAAAVVKQDAEVGEDSHSSSNYKDVPPDLPNLGSRDAAGEWACGFHGHTQGHKRHHMDRDRTYGMLAAKACWLREENKTEERKHHEY